MFRTSIVLFVAVLSVFAQSSSVQRRKWEWTRTYNEIVKQCFLENKEDTICYRRVINTHFKPTFDVIERPIVGVAEIAIPHIGRAIKNAAWKTSFLWSSDQDRYWLNSKIDKDYVKIKKRAVSKSKKENLRTCQQACLATCISSRIIKFSWEKRNQACTIKGRIESGTADCKGFSAIADDIMYSLGIPSRVVYGTTYKVKGDQLKRDYGHAMVQVKIEDEWLIMEPQAKNCRFYPEKFEKDLSRLGVSRQI